MLKISLVNFKRSLIFSCFSLKLYLKIGFIKFQFNVHTSKFTSSNPTNIPRAFHLETTWKRPFLRHFNVEYTWCVCRELAVSVTFSIVFKIFLVIQWHGTWTKPEYYRNIKVLNILWTPLDSRIIHDNLDLFRGPKETKDSNWNKIHISFNYEFLFAFSSTLEASTGGVL